MVLLGFTEGKSHIGNGRGYLVVEVVKTGMFCRYGPVTTRKNGLFPSFTK